MKSIVTKVMIIGALSALFFLSACSHARKDACVYMRPGKLDFTVKQSPDCLVK